MLQYLASRVDMVEVQFILLKLKRPLDLKHIEMQKRSFLDCVNIMSRDNFRLPWSFHEFCRTLPSGYTYERSRQCFLQHLGLDFFRDCRDCGREFQVCGFSDESWGRTTCVRCRVRPGNARVSDRCRLDAEENN